MGTAPSLCAPGTWVLPAAADSSQRQTPPRRGNARRPRKLPQLASNGWGSRQTGRKATPDTETVIRAAPRAFTIGKSE